MGLVMPSISYLLAQNLPAGSAMRLQLRRASSVVFVVVAAMLFGAMPTAVQGQSTSITIATMMASSRYPTWRS